MSSGGKNGNILLASDKELFEYIEKQLNDDWILLTGDRKYFAGIENELYPPGTPENAGFELYFIPSRAGGLGVTVVAMIKKNERLRHSLNLPNFSRIIGIELIQRVNSREMLSRQIIIENNEDRQRGIINYLNKFAAQLGIDRDKDV